jgi:hypothetical protein
MESGLFVITVVTFHRFRELSLGYLYSVMQGAIKRNEDFMSTYCGEILEMSSFFYLQSCIVKCCFCFRANNIKEM